MSRRWIFVVGFVLIIFVISIFNFPVGEFVKETPTATTLPQGISTATLVYRVATITPLPPTWTPLPDVVSPIFYSRKINGENRIYIDVVTLSRKGVVGTCRLEILPENGGDPIFGWENDCSIIHDSGAIELKPEEFLQGGKFEAKELILQIRRGGGWENAENVYITSQLNSFLATP